MTDPIYCYYHRHARLEITQRVRADLCGLPGSAGKPWPRPSVRRHTAPIAAIITPQTI